MPAVPEGERSTVTQYPRIIASATAFPARDYPQAAITAYVQERILGSHWQKHDTLRVRGEAIERLFVAGRVQHRQSVIDIESFYRRPRSTGERMVEYRTAGAELGR